MMVTLHDLPLTLSLPIGVLGGLLIGLIYFRAVKATADLLVAHGSPLLALVLTFGRLAMIGLGFYAAVQLGGLALVAALIGVLVAKFIMVRLTGRAEA